jgi:Fe2+ transport system protein FeoA
MQPIAPMLPLADLKAGEHATLQEIHTGRGVASRLSTLGFTPGVEIEMIQNFGHGPLVVGIRGTRVALGRQEASKALVSRRSA